MKIHLNNHCITDSTQEYEEGCLFLLTTQNKHYYSSQKKITPKQLLSSIDTKFIGITGTNGKTTTAFLTGYILNRLGYSVVVQGTEGVYLNGKKVEEKSLTTPPIISTIEKVYKYQPHFFVMEVSSHSIQQNRIDGIEFALKLFTNFSQDHLDYHKDMETYKKVKEQFFQDDSLKIINSKYTLNVNRNNCYYYPLKKIYPTQLKGSFNQENFQLAILGVSKLLNMDLDKVANLALPFKGVPGRMEEVIPNVFIDFAHTPDAIERVLSTLEGSKIVLFGAGGNRDRLKRAKMGEIADRYADYIILTNDNPRCEDERQIIDDIKKGISNSPYEIILDRKKAIHRGLELKEKYDYLFILGKGDEKYIEKCNKKTPFNDKQTLLKMV